MKPLSAFLALFTALFASVTPAGALYKPFSTDAGMARVDYGFQLEVLGADGAVKPEVEAEGDRKVFARPGERYSIRVYNPLPVRAVVNLTVDGVNTIDGKPCGIADGSRWMMEPMSWTTIRGWQVNGGEARRFFFTKSGRSYAAWRGVQLHRNLAANCGVIGAAFFWNRGELAQWQEEVSRRSCNRYPCASKGMAMLDKAEMAPMAKEKAGTGMGEREMHAVHAVEFTADAGMFEPKDALVLYYGFDEPTRPNPFPALSFAPEMP